jgi:hypothetical protein
MDQERPSPSASEVATVVPRWRSGSDIHQSTCDGALGNKSKTIRKAGTQEIELLATSCLPAFLIVSLEFSA